MCQLLNRRGSGFLENTRDPAEGARGGYGLRPWVRAFRALGLSRATLRQALEPRQGQSLVELGLVVPVLLLLVFAIVAFGSLYEDKITMDTAARDGARWASLHPSSWSSSTPAPSNTIQGQIQGELGTGTIPSDDLQIEISYYTPSSPTPGLCGTYGQTPDPKSNGCLKEGNLIKVTVTDTIPLPVPLISGFFPGGIRMQASATMMEEVSSS